MNRKFQKVVRSLEPQFRTLMRQEPVRLDALPRRMPRRGIYLLSEGRRHLYVGRSDRLRLRLQSHCSGSPYSASFAFLIARRKTGQRKATYKFKGSRADLMNNPTFNSAFSAATDRIKRMDIRYVREANPRRQALLEIYAATALNTRYNDFETH